MWFKVIHIPVLKVDGMALFPFILVRKRQYKANAALINHEKIHLAQQLELLIIPFYFLYFTHYLINLTRYRNHFQAYRNIVFEKEAFSRENELTYLNSRQAWAWRNFL